VLEDIERVRDFLKLDAVVCTDGHVTRTRDLAPCSGRL
jgi:hypothetical protein